METLKMLDTNYDPVLNRIHTCHNPNCSKPCPPKMLACKSCWFLLPKRIRDLIWKYYVPGQEIKKNHTMQYLDAMNQAIQHWNLDA